MARDSCPEKCMLEDCLLNIKTFLSSSSSFSSLRIVLCWFQRILESMWEEFLSMCEEFFYIPSLSLPASVWLVQDPDLVTVVVVVVTSSLVQFWCRKKTWSCCCFVVVGESRTSFCHRFSWSSSSSYPQPHVFCHLRPISRRKKKGGGCCCSWRRRRLGCWLPGIWSAGWSATNASTAQVHAQWGRHGEESEARIECRPCCREELLQQ